MSRCSARPNKPRLNHDPARYVIYLELEGLVPSAIEALAERFDAALQRANPVCRGFRTNALLGRPRLAIVTPGTFGRLRSLIADSDLPSRTSQLKIPRRISNPDHRALLGNAVIETSS